MRFCPKGDEVYPRSRSRRESNSSTRALVWERVWGIIRIQCYKMRRGALLESWVTGRGFARPGLAAMAFPITRLRRLRQSEQLRSMVRETRLSPTSLVYPMFVCPGEGVRKEVRSMPGVFNLSVDEAVKEAKQAHSLGVPAVILFGLPEKKDELATGAWADDGIVQQATRALKREVPGLIVMGDVCLCEYMSHGHCGIVQESPLAKPRGAAARDQ